MTSFNTMIYTTISSCSCIKNFTDSKSVIIHISYSLCVFFTNFLVVFLYLIPCSILYFENILTKKKTSSDTCTLYNSSKKNLIVLILRMKAKIKEKIVNKRTISTIDMSIFLQAQISVFHYNK